MPFGIQPIHLIIVAIVALIIFGPSRLPEIGRGLGRAMNEFRRGTREMGESFREEVKRPDVEEPTSDNHREAIVEGAGNFCTNCGSPNPSGARFCNKCGTQLQS